MAVRWYSTVVDCRDFASQARWRAGVLDRRIVFDAPDEVVLVPPHALDEADRRRAAGGRDLRGAGGSGGQRILRALAAGLSRSDRISRRPSWVALLPGM